MVHEGNGIMMDSSTRIGENVSHINCLFSHDLNFNLWRWGPIHKTVRDIGVEILELIYNISFTATCTHRPRIHSTRQSSADDVRHIPAGSIMWTCVVQGWGTWVSKLFCLSFSCNSHGPWVHHQMMAMMCLRGVMPISPLWKHLQRQSLLGKYLGNT